jgi:hypothetical protein
MMTTLISTTSAVRGSWWALEVVRGVCDITATGPGWCSNEGVRAAHVSAASQRQAAVSASERDTGMWWLIVVAAEAGTASRKDGQREDCHSCKGGVRQRQRGWRGQLRVEGYTVLHASQMAMSEVRD